MFKRYLNNEKGFSMIEMMVVLIIIAVLIGGGIKFYLGYIENARVTKAKAQISVMQAALDAYYAEKAVYPSTQGELLNAGIQAADDTTLDAQDPWGEEYTYGPKTVDSVANKGYDIKTGHTDVQGKGAHVIGSGEKGESTPPEVVVPTTP
ncbi:MAG: Type II secretion system protein G precursor [Firmicutes bacterium ADurb.Bin373]|nr:MAG: Type II secretion system protein G precursor [Firmicutes bacterium ADurb.Bin373]